MVADSLVVITGSIVVVASGIVTAIILGGLLLGLSWVWALLHVVHPRDVLIAAHINVEEIPLAKDIHAELEEEALGEALLHNGPPVRGHVPVGHDRREPVRVLAVLHGLTHAGRHRPLRHYLLKSVL